MAPIPSPGKKESKKEFINRCVSDPKMNDEYPNSDQRYAVCQRQWTDKKAEDAVREIMDN